MKKQLSDLGEFRLLQEIVLPTLGGDELSVPLGDDCAYARIPESTALLVVTSDAAPRPLVWDLGCKSYWSWGWYAVMINASDLAAAGARPFLFTSSVDAPESMLVDEFRSFFQGMAAACHAFSFTNAGGNIRAAPRFACHGTALGTEMRSTPISRSGCEPSDVVVSIGVSGRFISAYLMARRNGMASLPQEDRRRLFRPMPKLREMALLHEAGLIRAASDNSDGLLGALWNIVERSSCAIELDLDNLVIPEEVRAAARLEQLNPWNLFFFWGDWQVIGTVPLGKLADFQKLAEREQIEHTILGRAVEGESAVYGLRDGERCRMQIVRSENFAHDSFAGDLHAHLNFMLNSPLFVD